MRFLTWPCVLVLAFGCLDANAQRHRSGEQQQIPADQAHQFIGRTGTVCGVVVTTRYAQNAAGEPTFLHIGAAFPRQQFQVRINGEDRGNFEFAPEVALEGKLICASGRIAGRSNRPEMVIRDPSELALGVSSG